MANPFFSPKDARRESAAHVAEAAKQINPQLAAGNRVFHLPIGIAPEVAEGLVQAHEQGEPAWVVTQKPHQTEPDALATLVLTERAAIERAGR